MQINNFLKNEYGNENESLKRNILACNIYRGRILAVILSGFELIFAVIDISASLIKVDNRFQYKNYLVMYLVMILINVAYLFFISKYKDLKDVSVKKLRKLEIGLIAYITLIMSWGSIVSLMDQKLYGQLMVFMVNMITCSVFYLLNHRKILIPYIISVVILLSGLPFYQSSKDILIGHYVNLFIFVLISWLASRILYLSYCSDFKSNVLLEESKKLLQKEIEQNIIINNKLFAANLHLKELALIDELTGMPNRRGFRKFIDMAFENYFKEDSVLSFMMLDIDYFKQFNDTYGHSEGDKVIIAVANQIKSIVGQAMDFAARWGGEEFIYVSFNTDEEDIRKAAELIRSKVHDLKIPHKFSNIHNYISVSIGICTIRARAKGDVRKGIELADKALYFAKESGRNCVKDIHKM